MGDCQKNFRAMKEKTVRGLVIENQSITYVEVRVVGSTTPVPNSVCVVSVLSENLYFEFIIRELCTYRDENTRKEESSEPGGSF